MYPRHGNNDFNKIILYPRHGNNNFNRVILYPRHGNNDFIRVILYPRHGNNDSNKVIYTRDGKRRACMSIYACFQFFVIINDFRLLGRSTPKVYRVMFNV